MGRDEGDRFLDSFEEMGNRVLWVKLNLSYTARGIAKVSSSFGIGSRGCDKDCSDFHQIKIMICVLGSLDIVPNNSEPENSLCPEKQIREW